MSEFVEVEEASEELLQWLSKLPHKQSGSRCFPFTPLMDAKIRLAYHKVPQYVLAKELGCSIGTLKSRYRFLMAASEKTKEEEK